ncbi:hypothetical protein C2E20_4897 [Micractinium conductrix]|uniref:Uncharacterized protein n=1 Tax=Micractinium conductrix TaxID=554055 RepID=A0A2P6VCJ7_9CHLO|nr:hypothetical protein C2E20_4897 [Micractinium conductrix]|eukprot:PSC71804.1 hypothetical protein C2E20_4897 [Micractinium conductrix]
MANSISNTPLGAAATPGVSAFAAAAAATAAAAAQLPRARTISQGDATLLSMLAAAVPSSGDWLTAAAEAAAPAPVRATSPADLDLIWMDGQLGLKHDDAEAWLCAVPSPCAAPAATSLAPARQSSDYEVLPLPRIAISRPDSRRTTAQHSVAAQHSTTASARFGGRAASARPAWQSATAAWQTATASFDGRQTTAAALSSTTARDRSSPSRPATALPAKPMWPPYGGSPSRQTMPGTPAAFKPALRTGAATPARGAAASERRATADTAPAPLGNAQPLSPVSKVAQWLARSAVPAATSASGARVAAKPAATKPARAVAAQPSAAAGSDDSSWRIAVPPPAPAAAAAAAVSSPSFASRIPRPASTSAAASPTAAVAPRRSQLALKQLAQRALALGSSPPAPHPAHVRRPSSNLGGGASAARADGLAAGSPPVSPKQLRPYTPHWPSHSRSNSEPHLSSAGSCHRLSSSSSSPAGSPLAKSTAASSNTSSSTSSAAALTPPPADCLAATQAAAACALAASQAAVREAATEHMLLSRASPSAWVAAQEAAASSPAASSKLDEQLEQLERLSHCLSEASSHVSEMCLIECMLNSRRASSGAGSQRSRRSLASLRSPAGTTPPSPSPRNSSGGSATGTFAAASDALGCTAGSAAPSSAA